MFPCSSSLPLSPSWFLHLLLLLLMLLFTDPSFTLGLQEPVLASPSIQISSTPSNCSSCNNTLNKPAAEDSSGSISSLSSASNVNNNLTLNKSSSSVLVKNSTSVAEVHQPKKPNDTQQAKAPQPPFIKNLTAVSPGGDASPASSQQPVPETRDGSLINTNPPSQSSTSAGATPLTTAPLTNAKTVATGIPAPSTATNTTSTTLSSPAATTTLKTTPSTSSTGTTTTTLKTTPSKSSLSTGTTTTALKTTPSKSSLSTGTTTTTLKTTPSKSPSSTSSSGTKATLKTTPSKSPPTTSSSTPPTTAAAPPAPGTTVAPPPLPATTAATNTLQSTSLVTEVSGLALAGAALTKHLVDTASLLAVLVFGLLFFLVTVAVFLTQAYESYRRKDYTQVDYLINGMYTDSGV